MNRLRTIVFGVTVLLLTVAGGLAASIPTRMSSHDDQKYRVFCANGKVEVEQRTLEQEKNARGSNVCMLGEFDYLSDAEKEAEKRGGKGADCKCQ